MTRSRTIIAIALCLLLLLAASPPAAAQEIPDPLSLAPQVVPSTLTTAMVHFPADGNPVRVEPAFVGTAAVGFHVIVSHLPATATRIALTGDGQAIAEAEVLSEATGSFTGVPAISSNDYAIRAYDANGTLVGEADHLALWTDQLLSEESQAVAAAYSSCKHSTQATRSIYTGGSYNVGNGDFSTQYRDLIGGSWKSSWSYGSNCHSTRYAADYYMAFGIRGQNQMNGPGYYTYAYGLNSKGSMGSGGCSYFKGCHTVAVKQPRAFLATPTGVTASVVEAKAEGRPSQDCTSTFVLRAAMVFVKNIWAGIAGLFIPDKVCSTNWRTITTAASGASGRGNEFETTTVGDHVSAAGWITTRYDSRGEFRMKAEGDFYVIAWLVGWCDSSGRCYACSSSCDHRSEYWEYWQLGRQAKVT